eukprot:c12926_g1_i1.p1 GENE.c12926_g1_i1~~c12926_g1_i1.p1  ORF type:complete len:125 (-),score=5.33 c12926_g1_i1:80-454(-)
MRSRSPFNLGKFNATRFARMPVAIIKLLSASTSRSFGFCLLVSPEFRFFFSGFSGFGSAFDFFLDLGGESSANAREKLIWTGRPRRTLGLKELHHGGLDELRIWLQILLEIRLESFSDGPKRYV